jgi:hypothetical protein
MVQAGRYCAGRKAVYAISADGPSILCPVWVDAVEKGLVIFGEQ